MTDGPARIAAAGERLLERVWRASPWVVWGAWLSAVVVRMTVRDTYVVSGLVFYATPPAVLAGLPVLGALVSWRRHARTLGLLGLLVGAVGGVFVANRCRRGAVPREAPGEFEVLLWNAQRGARGIDDVVASVASDPADLVAVVEAASDTDDGWQAWSRGLPEHDVRRLPGGMVVAVRGSLERVDVLDSLPRSRAIRVACRVEDQSLKLVVVDVASNPFRSRQGRIGRILDETRDLVDGPSLVLGDFNTPADSVWFDAWRTRGWRHAFEHAGRGWYAGYKDWLPLLDLDHVWAGRGLDVLRARFEDGWPSDHKPLRVHVLPRDPDAR